MMRLDVLTRIETMNLGAFSLSSTGGEGWGEEAPCATVVHGLWRSLHVFLTRIGTMNTLPRSSVLECGCPSAALDLASSFSGPQSRSPHRDHPNEKRQKDRLSPKPDGVSNGSWRASTFF